MSSDARTIESLASGVSVRISAAPAGTIVAGTKAVTTAGTAVALVGTPTACRSVLIVAKPGNTGNIFVGISGACSATQYMGKLTAGQSTEIAAKDVSLIFIDSSVNTEGVNYYYFN